ncbi:hypothetical protein VaNZ11_009959 [Volvox africanus]|uniref:Cyclic nucleotide-binding domain-containing protein n=1 Tax=Volvox africanus TaxID=51714 RepID=A0ABQ5S8T9_9CHLO|nr:hypothetical protein VaNZ11_009959 [Volvox africanus]
MPHLPTIFSGWHNHYGQPSTNGTPELQTVVEADTERAVLPSDVPVNAAPTSDGVPTLESNPSQRPLGRAAPAPGWQNNSAVNQIIYAQEGDVNHSEFKETVAELLKEEEYGIFRLVVPSVELARKDFDEYLTWLQSPDRNEINPRSMYYFIPVVLPFSVPALFWTSLMTLVDLTWTAFGVPVNVAFCSVNYGRLQSGCTALDLCFGIIYLLNLLFSFCLGIVVVNGHRKKVVQDGGRVVWYYMRHGRFILDLVAVVPFVYLVVVLITSNGKGYQAKWVNAVSLIRLFRLLRLISVSKVIYIDSTLGADGWLSRYLRVSTLYVILVGFQIVVLMNLIACILVLLAYMHGLDSSWMSAVSWTDVPDASKFYQWYSAMYWVVTTTTTTGFGDFSPRWWAEQVVIGLAMVFGMIAFGILVGSVANALARADTSASRLQNHIKKISEINKWLSTVDLGEGVKSKIQEYFAQQYVAKQSVQYGEAELFADLPPYLRFEVAGGLTLGLVKEAHAFKELNLDAQQLIAAHLRPVRATVGQQLCRQGDEADRLWLLAAGELTALRHKEDPQRISAPALVGESLILAIDIDQCRYRPWTIRAVQPCQLWELHLADLSRVIQIYPAVRLTLMEYVRTDLVFSWFSGRGQPSESSAVQRGWCELSTLLFKTLLEMQEVDPAATERLCLELAQATDLDSSLQARLSELVEPAMVRDGLAPDALTGLSLTVQAQAAKQQQQQSQRQTSNTDTERPSGQGGSQGRGGGEGQSVTAAGAAGLPGAPGDLQHLGSGQRRGDGGAGSSNQRQFPRDTHLGPAPWGVTTEEVLAAGYTWPKPQPLPSMGQQTLLQQRESSRSSHGRRSPSGLVLPQRPGTPPSALQASLLQQQPARPIRRVASHHLSLAATSGAGDRDSGGSNVHSGVVEVAPDGMNRHLTAPPQMMASSPALDLSPAGSAGGAAVAAAAAGAGPLPSSPLSRQSGIGDDPISVETGVLSPHVQRRLQRQQQQQHKQEDVPGDQNQQPQPSRDSEAPEGSGAEAMETTGSTNPVAQAVAVALPLPPTSSGVSHHTMGSTGRPPNSAGGTGPRRSMLSRMSSPFAAISVPISTATATAGAGTAAEAAELSPAAPVIGRGTGPTGTVPRNGVGGNSETRHHATSTGSAGTCTACGACFCPQCGAWTVPTSRAAPAAHNHPSLLPTHLHQYGPPHGVAPHVSGSGAAPPATSLLNAIRGRVSAVNAAGSATNARTLLRNSSTPWPGVPSNGAESPTGVLSRRSHMFGRSFAARVRADSLMRNTVGCSREEEDPGSPIAAPRVVPDE